MAEAVQWFKEAMEGVPLGGRRVPELLMPPLGSMANMMLVTAMMWWGPGDLLVAIDITLLKMENGCQKNMGVFVCHCLPSIFSATRNFLFVAPLWPYSLTVRVQC
jgi:hypothetical protein